MSYDKYTLVNCCNQVHFLRENNYTIEVSYEVKCITLTLEIYTNARSIT